MDPVANPYTPGAGTRPPALTGRDRELERFSLLTARMAAGHQEKSMLITGLRGVGKTVLINTFEDIAEAAGFRTVFTEVSEDSSFPGTFARITRRALLSLSGSERMRDRVRRALGVLKAFTVRFPDGPEIGIDVEAITGRADSGDLEEDVADVLIELGEAARDESGHVLLLIDELQHLRQAQLGALIAGLHQIAQRQLPVALVGAGLPTLPRLAGAARSYAERLFDFPSIGSLDAAAAGEALTRPAADLDVAFETDAVAEIVELTEGYPYFIQEYGKHVWNVAKETAITLGDVDSARPSVQTQLDENFFRVRVDRVTGSERRYMRAMAELGSGPQRSGEIASKLDLQVTSVGPTRANLINKGLIYSPGHGLNDFTVPQFDDFLRRNFPPPGE